MYSCSKFNLNWRTSVFGTKFTRNAFLGGVLGQTQPENNLSYVKKYS